MLNLEKLKKIRELKGLSQNEVARRCNIAGSHYNNIERGIKGVSTDTLGLICNVLETDISDIWDPSENPPILPVKDKPSIIVEKTTNTTTNTIRFILPATSETLQFVSNHITGENVDMASDFKTVIENWNDASPEVKSKILDLLHGNTEK
ncbi:MAG: helix-turn-helix domain-containing protein [Prevotellaceae bacterium]|jgi:transcriptional regulator with XRE-family HTH domain|nr:helix-turn-helix domain-containing protein [Prevotellaceae bacterium]